MNTESLHGKLWTVDTLKNCKTSFFRVLMSCKAEVFFFVKKKSFNHIWKRKEKNQKFGLENNCCIGAWFDVLATSFFSKTFFCFWREVCTKNQIKSEKKTMPIFGTTVFLRSLKEQNDLKLFQIGAILSKNKKKRWKFSKKTCRSHKKKVPKKKTK